MLKIYQKLKDTFATWNETRYTSNSGCVCGIFFNGQII